MLHKKYSPYHRKESISISYSFAAGFNNAVDGVRNFVGGAENVVENVGNNVAGGIKNGMNTIGNGANNATNATRNTVGFVPAVMFFPSFSVKFCTLFLTDFRFLSL